MSLPDSLSGLSVSISVLAQMERYLSSINIDIRKVIASVGADPELLSHPDKRLPVETYIAIENAAADFAGDSCFGLHMGEFFEPGHWSILGYMMMNCTTLGDAFSKSGKYQKIIGNTIEGKIRPGFNTVKAILTVPKYAPAMSRHCFEAALSSSVRLMRTLTGKHLCPLEVGFNYPVPVKKDEYTRVFGCPVKFNQKYTYMIVPMSIGNTPALLPNENMKNHFEQFARKYIDEMEGAQTTTQEVTKLILERLDSKNISIKVIAKEMAMSVRTLQTRLEDEGTVYKQLLEETRVRLAKKYLKENYTVEDITFLLGFSDSSVFRKAFKKWTDITPREYRTGSQMNNEIKIVKDDEKLSS